MDPSLMGDYFNMKKQIFTRRQHINLLKTVHQLLGREATFIVHK